jgi:hypothetical protein
MDTLSTLISNDLLDALDNTLFLLNELFYSINDNFLFDIKKYQI